MVLIALAGSPFSGFGIVAGGEMGLFRLPGSFVDAADVDVFLVTVLSWPCLSSEVPIDSWFWVASATSAALSAWTVSSFLRFEAGSSMAMDVSVEVLLEAPFDLALSRLKTSCENMQLILSHLSPPGQGMFLNNPVGLNIVRIARGEH